MSRLEETRHANQSRTRGLVSDRASGARVDANTFAPPADLADIVEVAWLGRWDLPDDAPHVTRLLGDPCVHVVWEWGSAGALTERVVGVWTKLWVRTLAGRGAVRGFKLRAGAAAALVDDASAFTNAITELRSLHPSAPRAADLDAQSSADDAVFAALSRWLAGARRHHDDTRSAIDAVAIARADPRLTRVDQLCQAVGLSERSLQRLFRMHVGASPKQVLRRTRLQEAAERLQRGDQPSLTDLAFELGYADQAHFARDWRAAVATAPSSFGASRQPPHVSKG